MYFSIGKSILNIWNRNNYFSMIDQSGNVQLNKKQMMKLLNSQFFYMAVF